MKIFKISKKCYKAKNIKKNKDIQFLKILAKNNIINYGLGVSYYPIQDLNMQLFRWDNRWNIAGLNNIGQLTLVRSVGDEGESLKSFWNRQNWCDLLE